MNRVKLKPFHKRLFLFSVALVVFCYFVLDRPLAILLSELPEPVVNMAKLFTVFTCPEVLLTVLPLTLLLVKRYEFNYYRIISLLIGLCVALSITYIIKSAVGRARPELYLNNGIWGFYPFKLNKTYLSFPSSHATAAGALYGGLSLMLSNYKIRFLVLAALLSSVRVLVNKHFVSDVIAGLCIGYLCADLFVIRDASFFQAIKENFLKKLKLQK